MAGGWSSGQRKTRLHRRGSKIKHQFFLLCPSVPFHDRKSVLLIGLLSGYMVLEDSPARLVMFEESRKRRLPLLLRTHHGLTSWPCGQLRIKNERQTHTHWHFGPCSPSSFPTKRLSWRASEPWMETRLESHDRLEVPYSSGPRTD